MVEVIVGLCIFAMLSVYFLVSMMSASKEINFSGEHIDAMILSQKVGEDILEEVSLNPYGLETLGIASSKGVRHDVVDGSSIFFSYIEDRAAPWGYIEPTRDGMIDNRMPMYDAVKKFQFSISGDHLAKSGDHEDRNLVACKIDFFWEAKTGRGEYNSEFQLFSPVSLKKVDLSGKFDEASLDARIADEVFNFPEKSIGELATEIGENQQTILAIGRISLVCSDFAHSSYFKDMKNRIALGNQKLQYVSASANPDQYFKLSLELAKNWYEIGKSSYQIIAFLEPHFDELMKSGKFIDSLKGGFNQISFQHNLMSFIVLYEYFVASMVQSRYYYHNLLNPAIVKYKGARAQQQVILKLLDLYRVISAFKSRPGGMSEYRTFVAKIRDWAKNRNPFLERTMAFEQKLMMNQSDWMARFPNLSRINDSMGTKIPAILDFISKQTNSAFN
jgi:hypothetical protein